MVKEVNPVFLWYHHCWQITSGLHPITLFDQITQIVGLVIDGFPFITRTGGIMGVVDICAIIST